MTSAILLAQAEQVPAAPVAPPPPMMPPAPTPPAAPAPEASDPISLALQTVSDWVNYAASNYEWMHQTVFYVLYAMLLLATLVIIERLIYYAVTLSQAKRVARALDKVKSLDEVPERLLKGSTVAVAMLRYVLSHREQIATRSGMEDATEGAFIEAKGLLGRRLWILDTAVTAAPLLGLLGTILGIIDTFSALAQAGISDPAAVSKGIGLALFATALGIATALYGLLFFNVFQERIARITDLLKMILLRIGLIGASRPAN